MDQKADTPKKTWKRELASVIMSLFWYIVLSGGSFELIEILIWPVFTFTALAFGLDWLGKSSDGVFERSPELLNRGRPQRSSEYPDREEQYPDYRSD